MSLSSCDIAIGGLDNVVTAGICVCALFRRSKIRSKASPMICKTALACGEFVLGSSGGSCHQIHSLYHLPETASNTNTNLLV